MGVAPMHEIKIHRYKGSWILKFAVLCFAAFFLFSLVNQQMQIHDKQNTLDALQSQLKTQQIKNEELKNSLEKDEDLADYAEKVARRDLDSVSYTHLDVYKRQVQSEVYFAQFRHYGAAVRWRWLADQNASACAQARPNAPLGDAVYCPWRRLYQLFPLAYLQCGNRNLLERYS